MIALLTGVLLAATTPPAAAVAQSAPTLLPEEQPVLAELQKVRQLPDTAQLDILDAALTKLLRPTLFRANLVCTRAALLGRMQRVEFKAAAANCYRLLPTNPRAAGMYATSHISMPTQCLRHVRIWRRFEPTPISPKDCRPTQYRLCSIA